MTPIDLYWFNLVRTKPRWTGQISFTDSWTTSVPCRYFNTLTRLSSLWWVYSNIDEYMYVEGILRLVEQLRSRDCVQSGDIILTWSRSVDCPQCYTLTTGNCIQHYYNISLQQKYRVWPPTRRRCINFDSLRARAAFLSVNTYIN